MIFDMEKKKAETEKNNEELKRSTKREVIANLKKRNLKWRTL